jgi:hypothetical protein
VAGDAAGSLRMHEFDARREAYTGPVGTYQLDDPAHAIGDAIAVDDRRFLVIERDSGQGDAAQVKKIYLATKSRGRLDKTLVADLLDIANPKRLGGFGPTFRRQLSRLGRTDAQYAGRQRVHHHSPGQGAGRRQAVPLSDRGARPT